MDWAHLRQTRERAAAARAVSSELKQESTRLIMVSRSLLRRHLRTQLVDEPTVSEEATRR
ncbi:hypothetical protein ABZ930_23565 [Streptomyces sp. NPDC046716]|uniref:hypothetical protein n=1 Tax=Streptomyces sp. NPDC046716 TaxID=3157093 RepID=UPI0033FFC257